jgi:DNA-binding transcriptional ArsR family regulator
MMQEIQEIGAKSFGHGSRVSGQSFVVLLALARKPLTEGELCASFGMNPSEFGELLDRLLRNRLVDVVSEVEGRGVGQTLCLTNKGEIVLLREMEQMCELPER